ncbi:unnamed protein product [Rhizoctonia solani]|uniref:Uncharacterized protein n=1 Tax=Rhizoctonia solani TaxID=456999 RepID=A0A8H3C3F1_9AGAM|nr:unnamed protein product [Rhizoctonia solani]
MAEDNENIQLMHPKSHAVIEGSFDRDPARSIWATFSTGPQGGQQIDLTKVNRPFVAVTQEFYEILGPDAALRVIAKADTPEFHEAGVYIHETSKVFFTSNKMNGPGPHPPFANFSKIGPGSIWEIIDPPSDSFVLPNGGTVYDGKVLMAVQGYKLDVPSSLMTFDPRTHKAEVLLNNFFGRPFNSINDVVVLMRPGGDRRIFMINGSFLQILRTGTIKASRNTHVCLLRFMRSIHLPVHYGLLQMGSNGQME